MQKTSFKTPTLFVSIILLFLFGGLQGKAESMGDYSFSLNGRSTPGALQGEAVAGYTSVLWGDSKNDNPFYGYVRPSVDLALSSTATGIVGLDIYPVSFFGFTVGRTYNNRLADLPSLDCDKVDCRDALNSTFVQARLLGKWHEVLGSLMYQQDAYDANDDLKKSFGDGSHIVWLAPEKEKSEQWQAILAFPLVETVLIGINAQDFRTHKTNERQEQQLLFLRKSQDDWIYTVAFGRFAAEHFGVGPQAIFSVTWVGKEKIAP